MFSANRSDGVLSWGDFLSSTIISQLFFSWVSISVVMTIHTMVFEHTRWLQMFTLSRPAITLDLENPFFYLQFEIILFTHTIIAFRSFKNLFYSEVVRLIYGWFFSGFPFPARTELQPSAVSCKSFGQAFASSLCTQNWKMRSTNTVSSFASFASAMQTVIVLAVALFWCSARGMSWNAVLRPGSCKFPASSICRKSKWMLKIDRMKINNKKQIYDIPFLRDAYHCSSPLCRFVICYRLGNFYENRSQWEIAGIKTYPVCLYLHPYILWSNLLFSPYTHLLLVTSQRYSTYR